jgi:hypothetical protein
MPADDLCSGGALAPADVDRRRDEGVVASPLTEAPSRTTDERTLREARAFVARSNTIRCAACEPGSGAPLAPHAAREYRRRGMPEAGSSAPAVRLERVTRRFGTTVALGGVELEVRNRIYFN